jgi:hypothetical protein
MVVHAEGIHMTRDATLPVSGPGRVSTMKNWRYIAMHTVAAATFIFLLQRYGLNASFDSALLWALTFGAAAAGLAYSQSKR